MTDRTQPLSARYKAGNRPAGVSNKPQGAKPRRPLGQIDPLGPAHAQEHSDRVRKAKKGQLR